MSSSSVKNYIALLGIRPGRSRLVEGVLNASIGPITSITLREHQLSVDVQASEYTIPGLIDALVKHADIHSRPDEPISLLCANSSEHIVEITIRSGSEQTVSEGLRTASALPIY